VAKTTLVRVVEGNMNAMQVKMEMERLVPAKVSWEVEEIEKNTFKTIFPSKGEMLRMIEWGKLQTKDQQAKLVIEELGGGSSVKQVMRKVLVQMARLPSELRDYLTIWVISTILGVTKDVDMIFTRQYNRPRMQVLVLDLEIIPSSVDVVIGDNIYELHFRVELEGMQESPHPLDMEDANNEFDKKEEDEGGNDDQHDFMQEDSNQPSFDKDIGRKPSAQSIGTLDVSKGKKVVYHSSADVHVVEKNGVGATPPSKADVTIDVYVVEEYGARQENRGSNVECDGIETYSEDGLMDVFQEEVRGDEPACPDAMQLRELAAISEADTPSHKSKRRTNSEDEHSLDRAERIKVVRNLDFTKEKGNTSMPPTSFVHFPNECVVDKLAVIDISLGNNIDNISASVSHTKEVELGRLEGLTNRDRISDIFIERRRKKWKMRK
jgi:hypothetical protein